MKQEESSTEESSAPLVEVTRGAMAESLHRGFIAVLEPDGREIATRGEIDTRTWYRSAAKPFQTIAMIASGAADAFAMTSEELAVITGSHSGEAIHVEVVRALLARIGMPESALGCGAHLPFDEATAKRMRAEGSAATALHNNCSGKHTGMLAFALRIGASTEAYLDPSHPIQWRIHSVLATFTGGSEDAIAIAVDGCSAPVFGHSLRAMARSYACLMNPRESGIEASLAEAADRVVSAMIAHPEMVGGTSKRLDTDLMRVAGGRLVSKVGAEGVQLLGVKPCERYPRGLGIAIKIEDGDIRRARDPVVIETLRQLGLLDEEQIARLAPYARATVRNHRGLAVGEVRPCFQLRGNLP